MLLQLLAQNTGAGAGWAIGGFIIVWIIIAIIASIFWIWMLIDCIVSDLPTVQKVLWFCVIFFLHLLGAVIYFFIGRPRHAHRVVT